ncbi:MAG: ABC transporter permease [Acidobacteriota bacterium]
MASLPLQDAFFLSLRSLRGAPWRSLTLVLGTSVALFLPLFTYNAAARLEVELLERARSSPVLVGRKGDEFDLAMSSLYFRGQIRDTVRFAERRRLGEYGLAVPLFVAYSVSGTPLVGTSIEYFEARELEVAEGRVPVLLGEVVAGAAVAERLRLEVGDRVRSDLTNLYNLAGAYPLLLEVVGVLEHAGSPDDEAFFTDIKTTWILEGRLHGHEEVTEETSIEGEDDEENRILGALMRGETAGADGAPDPEEPADPGQAPDSGEGSGAEASADEAADAELAEAGDGEDGAIEANENLEASAAIFLFAELTPENRGSFHMHGSEDDAPVGSFLILPEDRKAHDQLLGDLALDETHQAVRPVEVIGTVLEIVLRLRDGLSLYFFLVAASTLGFFTLVISLSLRLRRQEIQLMRRLGCGRFHIATLIGVEVALVALAAGVLASGATALGLRLLESVI